jgi:hypothetical protein
MWLLVTGSAGFIGAGTSTTGHVDLPTLTAGAPSTVWKSGTGMASFRANGRPSLSEELREVPVQVLIAAETGSVPTERLFRTMNLIGLPADYSPIFG